MKTTNKSLHHVEWSLPNVVAFTTTRKSPAKIPLSINSNSKAVKNEPYDAFNLGDHVGDSPVNVLMNRNILKKELLAQSAVQTHKKISVQWLKQVHEADVVVVKEHSEVPHIADAAITRVPNLALAIMTADCLPILIAAKDGSEIAAIHGGWKPLAKNIIANTLSKMSSVPSDLCVWLGPCISQKAFEVGSEVKAEFTRQGSVFEKAFNNSTKQGHFLANLHEIARIQLKALGITDITSLPHCTYEQSQEYFSYRRDGVTGRMASVIMIKNS